MELDKRSRYWIVTVPWHNALPDPKQDDIPRIPYIMAHLKHSKENETISIWFSFTNPQRSSTVSTAFDCDKVVLKASRLGQYDEFKHLPCDSDLLLEDVSHGTKEHDDSNTSKPTSGTQPVHTYRTNNTTVQEEEEGPHELSTDIFSDICEYNRLKRNISSLDEELGRVVKRLKPYGELIYKIGEDIMDM